MKKNLLLALAAMLMVAFASCDDSTEEMGLSLLPDKDVIDASGTLFDAEFSNFIVDMDSVYSSSATAYLGKYTDETFGDIEMGFMTQLFCLNNFTFEFPKVVKDSIGRDEETGKTKYKFKDVTCYINLEYTSFFGDSINPCQVEAYLLNKDIDGNMASSVDPTKYYDEQTGYLGKVTYTAANTFIEESQRDSTRILIIRLPEEIAQDIMNKNYAHPEYFSNAKEFSKHVIKGLYLKPKMGDGTILYVNNSMLSINFSMYADSAGVWPIKRKAAGHTDEDSTLIYNTSFNSTREVYQVNTFKSHINDNILNDAQNTYLKTPAGLYTSIKIPAGEILSHNEGRDSIMQVKLTLSAYNQNKDNAYYMEKPQQLLLVRKADTYKFFKENALPDNINSFTAQLDKSTNTYTFTNISSFVAAEKEKAKTSEGKYDTEYAVELVAIPVVVKSETVNDQNQVTSVRNDMKPQYAKIIKTNNKLEVIYITIGK